VVGSKEEKHPEGAYYLDWYEGKKRIRLSVGRDAADAFARKQRREAELRAVAEGATLVSDVKTNGADGDKHSLAVAVAAFLEETKLTKKPKTYAAYSKALEYFQESCHKLYVEDIDRTDMLKFAAFLRDEKEQAPRSAYNKFENVMTFLKAAGRTKVVKAGDWPRYVEEEPETYEKDELDTLFAVCDASERLWFEFFLMTGFREQEAMYTTWRDVDFNHRTVSVRWKSEYNWTPKAYKERTVPIPAKLVTALKAHKAKAVPSCALVFPTSGCKPKFDFLDCLKATAKRAKLDESEFYLHKFRSTFATWHLWAGVDLRTVQSWLGHTDLESTLRYLKPSRSKETRAKVDATFA
jgi:integrase